MPRNGAGTYVKAVSDFVSATTISSSDMNTLIDDIVTALTNSIAKNGETTVTGNIPMGSKKLTGLTTGSALTDSITLGQAQNGGFLYATSSGTDTITVTLTPSITAYAEGQVFRFKAGGTNTGAITIDFGPGAKTGQINGSAVPAGAIESGKFYEAIYDGTQFQLAKWEAFSNDLPPTWLSGCTISNNGTDADHDIDIAAGVLVDSTDGTKLAVTALTKKIDASWAAGTDAGGFPTGISLSTSTWYHVFVIRKSDGTIDAGFDTSTSATNLLADATSYTEYRRIGSVLTDGSSNILGFTQKGNFFLWDDPPLDINTTTLSTTSVSYALSVPPVAGITAQLNVNASNASGTSVYVRDLDADDEAATTDGLANMLAGTTTNSVRMEIGTNSSKQIAARAGAASTTLKAVTTGWYDRLGRDW